MRIDVSPTLRRLLIELALGRDAVRPVDHARRRICLPDPARHDRRPGLGPARRDRRPWPISARPGRPRPPRPPGWPTGSGGSWPSWSPPRTTTAAGPGSPPATGGRSRAERPAGLGRTRPTPSRAARAVGLLPEPAAVDKAANYLAAEFDRAGGDSEARAAILHALAALGKASFEQANTLNRVRQALPDVALAYLALTLAKLDRATLAGEVLDVLAPRAKTESAGAGKKPRKYWEGADQGPYHRGAVETTALAALAFARVRPAGARGRGGRRVAPGPPAGRRLAARTRPRGRPSPPWPRSTARPGRPRTAIGWSSPSTTPRSTGPRSSARPRGRSSLVPRKALKVGDREPGPVPRSRAGGRSATR